MAKNTKALDLQEGKQLYRLFNRIDSTAYTLQGEATICALRKGRYGIAEKSQNGTTVFVKNTGGDMGVAVIVGKDIGNSQVQAGRFVLDVSGWIRLKDWKALGAFVKKNGERLGNGFAFGLGKHYGLFFDGKRVKRLESKTCQRGARWFYALDKKGLAYRK